MAKSTAKAKAKIADPDMKHIQLVDIIPDPNQPRKYFNEHKMQELVDSIRELGVVQPILVRPHEGKYMIVAGERRWRASAIVAVLYKSRNTIPAMVENLNDQQTLEIQITENLHRDNVKPMEEAVTFKSLIEQHNISIDDIALRVGKSTKFVAQRLNLNDLIPDFQEMLDRELINITQGYEIARVSTELQNQLLEQSTTRSYDNKKFDWRTQDSFSLSFYVLRNSTNVIENAKFNPEDPSLNPKMGVCSGCIYNSANSQLLFDGAKPVCTNPVCWSVKENASFVKCLDDAAVDPEIIIGVNSYSLYNLSEGQKAILKERGIIPLTTEDFRVTLTPEHPGDLETFIADSIEFNYDEDDEDSNLEEIKKEAEEEYKAELREYKIKLEQHELALKKGSFRKAINLITGKEMYVELKPKSKNKAPNASDDKKLLISQIEEREARAKELDSEKIYKNVIAAFKPVSETLINDELQPEEMVALSLMIIDHTWKARQYAEKSLKVEYGYGNSAKFFKALQQNWQTIFPQIVRISILEKLYSEVESNILTRAKAKALYSVAKVFIPDDVKRFEFEQEEKAIQRQERVNKKILAIDPKKKVQQYQGIGKILDL